MNCFLCKKPITTAYRVLVPARNCRMKTKFRDVCRECYIADKKAQGYRLEGGMWVK